MGIKNSMKLVLTDAENKSVRLDNKCSQLSPTISKDGRGRKPQAWNNAAFSFAIPGPRRRISAVIFETRFSKSYEDLMRDMQQ
jgi:hypothetical protein